MLESQKIAIIHNTLISQHYTMPLEYINRLKVIEREIKKVSCISICMYTQDDLINIEKEIFNILIAIQQHSI